MASVQDVETRVRVLEDKMLFLLTAIGVGGQTAGDLYRKVQHAGALQTLASGVAPAAGGSGDGATSPALSVSGSGEGLHGSDGPADHAGVPTPDAGAAPAAVPDEITASPVVMPRGDPHLGCQ